MGSIKAFRQPNATNSDGSKMLSYKHTNTTHSKPLLTIQERLQDASLHHWRLPIDEALDLHLHGLLTFSGKTLTPDSWTKWPKNYCRAMIQLVQLVSPAQANALLTAKMAGIGLRDREIGTQPRVVREVVDEVKKGLGLGGSTVGKKVAGGRVEKTHDSVRGGGVKVRGNGKGQQGRKSGKI
jgi:hypothetical protein